MSKENINNRTKRPLEEEKCPDKTCSDAKATMKKWFTSPRPDSESSQCPLDRETLGRYTWGLLHTIAAKYPMRPSSEDKSDMQEFIRLMSKLYPCTYCAEEFRKDMKDLPPKLDSRKALAEWFCQIHNRVNVRLNKPSFDCSKVDERWRTGWKDGSCM